MTACILLAGGLGTRLRGAVPGVPKCLAPVAGTTFLHIQIRHLASQGIESFTLSLGHLADQVISVAKTLSKSFAVSCVVEPQPLDTGGAVLFAMHQTSLSEAVVANADTLVEGDCTALLAPLEPARNERIRMALVRSIDSGRFGTVVMDAGRVRQLGRKALPRSELVNAGLYRVHRNAFTNFDPGQAFSLEADVIADLATRGNVTAAVVNGAFTDIGVPKDYFRFCERYKTAPELDPRQPSS
jgi:D-glycero-alpha-D-manno-heptose 1-phosphate guanylyltransferase